MQTHQRSLPALLKNGRPVGGREHLIGAALFVAMVAIVQVIDLLNTPSIFYDGLIKADYAPPGWAFAPIWSALWLLTAAAGFLVWQRKGFGGAPVALGFWCLHLIGNVGWTIVFFRLQNLALATFWIAMLQAIVAGAVIGAWQVRPVAGALLCPLLGWLGFATIVTADISRLN